MRPGKRPGAFCAYTVPSQHPYLLLNWTSRRRDVLTLAHELGHGLHAYLAREQGDLPPDHAAHPGRDRVGVRRDGHLRPAARRDRRSRAAPRAARREPRGPDRDRVPPGRDEPLRGPRAHAVRRDEGELSVEQFSEAWAATQAAMLGDAVEITDGYRTWWSYIPHFMGTPGYVYAYAYGQLLALSVYRAYEEQGADFVPRYLELLASGGSQSPEELGAIVGPRPRRSRRSGTAGSRSSASSSTRPRRRARERPALRRTCVAAPELSRSCDAGSLVGCVTAWRACTLECPDARARPRPHAARARGRHETGHAGVPGRERNLEIVAALLLAITTLAIAWSGYQAAKWSGLQARRFTQASTARAASRTVRRPRRHRTACRTCSTSTAGWRRQVDGDIRARRPVRATVPRRVPGPRSRRGARRATR